MPTKYKTDLVKVHLYNEILKGTTQSELVDKLNTDFWGVGQKYPVVRARELLSKVRKEVREDWNEEKAELRETTLARLMSLYTECLDQKDRQTALKTLQEISKITGLYDAQKLDVSLNANIEIDFGFGEYEN